jgi:hypothetical protein
VTKNVQRIERLEALYHDVNTFDSLQEECMSLCVKLTRLEQERGFYEVMDLPTAFIEAFIAIDEEYKDIEKQITVLENKLSKIEISSILLKIEKYENFN